MKKKPALTDVAIGMAWYRKDQWERLRQVSADADKLEATYESWLAYASEQIAEAAKAGIRLGKVDIDLDELIRWCRERNVPIDGKSRSEFTSLLVRKKHQPES